MAHPNEDLAREIRACLKAVDVSSVDTQAVPGKRKGFLVLDRETSRYKLTPKGNEFMAKWAPAKAQ